jgi:hypothetical protein
MDAAAMSLELHERGIHAVRLGAGDDGVKEVRLPGRQRRWWEVERRGSKPARSV